MITTSCSVAGLEVAGNGKNGVVFERSSCQVLAFLPVFITTSELTYIAALAVVVGSCCCSGGFCRVGVFVVDGSQSVGLIGQIAIRAEIGTHPVYGRGCSDGLHDDIAALTDTKRHDVGGVRLDGHKIVGNDCHVVAVDSEALNTFSAGVDKP